jgi:catechol 2,3-dioxygenase
MPYRAHPDTCVGHVHLKVSDLERSVAFYRDVLGFDLTQRYGAQAAFMSAGTYHHHLGLNTWESRGGAPAGRGHPGLYHVAFLYPDRAALGQALVSVKDAGVAITGAADHGVSEAIYFDDPDGNGIEIYRDRAPEDWPRDANGDLQMVNAPLDLDALIAEGRAAG